MYLHAMLHKYIYFTYFYISTYYYPTNIYLTLTFYHFQNVYNFMLGSLGHINSIYLDSI